MIDGADCRGEARGRKTGALRPRVLVATDLSDPAGEALVQADVRARLVDARLGVCHVAPSAGVHMLFPQLYSRDITDDLARDALARATVAGRVTSATGRAPDSFDVFVDHGRSEVEIVRRAEDWGATLLVVGSHGGAAPALGGRLGGVAEKVVASARCPVLVVRPPARRGLVVCATDFSAAGLPEVEAAVVEARLRGAKLVVVHIVDEGAPLASVRGSEGVTPMVLSPELLGDLRAAAHDRIAAVLSKLGAHAATTIVEGHRASSLLKILEDDAPELVVVGTRGRTGLARAVLGSVAEAVVGAARTSVLVVRLHP